MEETRQKLEETVLDILRQADLSEITEFKVRTLASERLGIELSGIDQKAFIRGVVESFLLSTAENTGDGKEANPNPREETKEGQKAIKIEVNENGDRVICKLSNKRNVVVHDFRGKTYVSIRDFYKKDGKQLPSATGVTMTNEVWSTLKNNFLAIEEAVTKMQSKIRSDLLGEQNVDVSNSVAAVPDFCPVETTRFDGKNYHCWATEMELFLKQMKIAYVLSDPCPSAAPNPEVSSKETAQAKAAEQKWVTDDYLCRQNILNCLSDHLYHHFSKKTKGAKELWEELKLVYLYEEFGTKRSHVRQYIEYQMVEGKPILEQVQELNNIADSIIATGMMIDENFHISAIIAKLPPSWKDFSIKTMREESLPFWTLMNHIRAEEESRNREKQGEHSKSGSSQPTHNFGPSLKRPGFSSSWKRQESEMHSKPLFCNNCGKKGHISRFCRSRKVEKEVNQKQDEENRSAPAVSEVNMVQSNVDCGVAN